MSEAKVRVSLADGTIEVEGSETFVTQQMDQFRAAIEAGMTTAARPRIVVPPVAAQVTGAVIPPVTLPVTPPLAGDLNGNHLEDVFAPTDTGVQILKDIPGDSKAVKMVNAAVLLLFGLTKLKSKDTVLFEEVAAVCKAHGCLDSGNMSSTLKAEKETFIFGGSGRKQTLKLTVPGTKTAAKLVDELTGTPQA